MLVPTSTMAFIFGCSDINLMAAATEFRFFGAVNLCGRRHVSETGEDPIRASF